MKHSSKSLAQKHLAHISAPANTQNNDIKLSGFALKITKTSTQGNEETFRASEKFFSSENYLAIFYD